MPNEEAAKMYAVVPVGLMHGIILLLQATPCGTMNARAILNGLESKECWEEALVHPDKRQMPTNGQEEKPKK